FCVIFFFFFQAESGIRDDLVTGVQTCALPIYDDRRGAAEPAFDPSRAARRGHVSGQDDHADGTREPVAAAPRLPLRVPRGGQTRSEERRVGKGGRQPWTPDGDT